MVRIENNCAPGRIRLGHQLRSWAKRANIFSSAAPDQNRLLLEGLQDLSYLPFMAKVTLGGQLAAVAQRCVKIISWG